MESKEEKHYQLFLLIYKGLKICLVVLCGVFIGGTIYGVFLHINVENHSEVIVSLKVQEGQTFTGIGRLRISTSDENPGMVILFVSFLFDPDDKAFSEELALRVKEFRQVIMDYLGSFSVSELQMLSEDSIKTELLHRFNAILRLGQIDALYFSDFMIIN